MLKVNYEDGRLKIVQHVRSHQLRQQRNVKRCFCSYSTAIFIVNFGHDSFSNFMVLLTTLVFTVYLV